MLDSISELTPDYYPLKKEDLEKEEFVVWVSIWNNSFF